MIVMIFIEKTLGKNQNVLTPRGFTDCCGRDQWWIMLGKNLMADLTQALIIINILRSYMPHASFCIIIKQKFWNLAKILPGALS